MDEERRQAWIEEQLKKAPPIDWDAWEASNVILGIKVKRRETNALTQAEDATEQPGRLSQTAPPLLVEALPHYSGAMDQPLQQEHWVRSPSTQDAIEVTIPDGTDSRWTLYIGRADDEFMESIDKPLIQIRLVVEQDGYTFITPEKSLDEDECDSLVSALSTSMDKARERLQRLNAEWQQAIDASPVGQASRVNGKITPAISE